jgi:hypothetical protein
LLFPRPFSLDDAKIEGPLIVEQHHLAYGKPWCLGRDQFRLKVDHRGRHESTFFREIRQFTELVSISC